MGMKFLENKSNLKILLILVIVLLIGYLIYINYNENKSIESFMTRNSLSSYFQSDDDLDSNLKKKFMKNELRYTNNFMEYLPSKWNGSYTFEYPTNELHYVTFQQVNTDILFVMHKVKYNISGDDIDPYKLKDQYKEGNENKQQCLPYMIIGKGELNRTGDIFYMKHVYCSSGGDGSNSEFYEPFKKPLNSDYINYFYGTIDVNNNIKIVQQENNGSGTEVGSAQLKKVDNYKYGPSAAYLLFSSYNIPVGNYKNFVGAKPDACYNAVFTGGDNTDYEKGELEKCYIHDVGMATPTDTTTELSQNGQKYIYNNYGTGCRKKGSKGVSSLESSYPACPTSDQNKTCYIPIKNQDGTAQIDSVGNYPKCDIRYELSVKNQSSISYPIYKKEETSGNILDLCSHLEGFKDKKYNSAIIMYVDKLSTVHTLHFDFFGVEKNQSFLNTKFDIMFPYMNENILNQYRENISDEKSLRLTNCIENNNRVEGSNPVKNFNDLLNSCNTKYANVDKIYDSIKQKIESSKKKDVSNRLKTMYESTATLNTDIDNISINRLLQPTVWSLSFLENDNTGKTIPEYSNDCSFTLSTSNKYTKEGRFIKHAEFDSTNNKTKMSLYKGGNKQKLVLENPYVINSLEEEMGSSDYNSIGPNNSNSISDEFILLSGNLRTFHPKKYLLPGQGVEQNGDFGKQLYLSDDLNPSGKWLILGFNLTKDLDVANSTNLYNSTLVKTLKKIAEKINS